MKLEKILKRIIMIVAIVLLGVVFVLNIFLISSISNDNREVIWTRAYSVLGLFMSGLIAIGIYILCNRNYSFSIRISKNNDKIVNLSDKQIKTFIATIMIIAYFVGQVIWINYRNSYPVYDQQRTYNAAKSIYENNDNYILKNQYFELYPQQLTTAKIWSVLFSIFGSSSQKNLQYVNVFANCLSLIAIYLITTEFSKRYKVNKFTPLIIYMTFLTVPMLSTFVYGDEPSMAMSLFSVYFIMKYGRTNKCRYSIISAILMAISYALRMNNLIWMLAIIIYLVLNLFKKEDSLSNNKGSRIIDIIWKLAILVMFTFISILPATIIKSSMQEKYELNPQNRFPVLGFLCIGMENGQRSAGWYDDEIADLAWLDIENAKSEYPRLLKEKISNFAHNPIQAAKFYIKKTASMWTENTYAEIWYNQSFNIGRKSNWDLKKDEIIRSKEEKFSLYQKALVLIIFGVSLAVILKNKDNLSNEVLLLLTIFIGGFLFHTLWEAKSRYIISYIVALIPITAIGLKDKTKIKRKDAI